MKKARGFQYFVCVHFCVLLFLTLLTKPSYSEETFAFLQFKDPRTGLVQMVFKKCDSAWVAKKLNESHWNGVKTSCPDCIKEIDSSLKKIPPAFEGIYQNKPILFPYLSSKHERVVYLGVPMKRAIEIALQVEDAYEKILKRPAKAILPLHSFE